MQAYWFSKINILFLFAFIRVHLRKIINFLKVS